MEGLICSSDSHRPCLSRRGKAKHESPSRGDVITAPRHGDVVCEADCTTGRPLRPAWEALGHMPGQGPRGRRHCQCLGEWQPPSPGACPRGPVRGFCLLPEMPALSAALCGHELGQPALSWRVPPSSIGRSRDGGRAALIQAFGGKCLK